MLKGPECQRTELTVYSTQAFNNVVILFRSSRKCGAHPLPLPPPFTDVCIRVVNTHNNGTNQSWSKADNDGEVPNGETAKKVDEAEDKPNGGDGLIGTALCRLHICGCGGLSCNHRGGGGGLQGGRGQDRPDRKALLHRSHAQLQKSSAAHCCNSLPGHLAYQGT